MHHRQPSKIHQLRQQQINSTKKEHQLQEMLYPDPIRVKIHQQDQVQIVQDLIVHLMQRKAQQMFIATQI